MRKFNLFLARSLNSFLRLELALAIFLVRAEHIERFLAAELEGSLVLRRSHIEVWVRPPFCYRFVALWLHRLIKLIIAQSEYFCVLTEQSSSRSKRSLLLKDLPHFYATGTQIQKITFNLQSSRKIKKPLNTATLRILKQYYNPYFIPLFTNCLM